MNALQPDKRRWSYTSGTSDTPLLGLTIGDLFDQTVATYPDQPALISRQQKIRLSYRELQAEVNRCARALLHLGVSKGQRVGIWSPNRAEWCITQFATSKIGRRPRRRRGGRHRPRVPGLRRRPGRRRGGYPGRRAGRAAVRRVALRHRPTGCELRPEFGVGIITALAGSAAVGRSRTTRIIWGAPSTQTPPTRRPGSSDCARPTGSRSFRCATPPGSWSGRRPRRPRPYAVSARCSWPGPG